MPPVAVGTEDVGAHHDPVAHRDRHIPVDPHPVAELGELRVAPGAPAHGFGGM
jgi:hypothetical protein